MLAKSVSKSGCARKIGSKLVGGRGLGDMEAIKAHGCGGSPLLGRQPRIVGSHHRESEPRHLWGNHGGPAGPAQRALARISYRVLKWTTTRRKANGEDYEGGAFRNPILERSRHPYGRALLDSSCREHESLVEGGDPMNGPYMMICPEILKVSDIWDRLFLHSVQSRDVQLRFIWETRATYDAARSRLKTGGVVRLKAVAAALA